MVPAESGQAELQPGQHWVSEVLGPGRIHSWGWTGAVAQQDPAWPSHQEESLDGRGSTIVSEGHVAPHR